MTWKPLPCLATIAALSCIPTGLQIAPRAAALTPMSSPSGAVAALAPRLEANPGTVPPARPPAATQVSARTPLQTPAPVSRWPREPEALARALVARAEHAGRPFAVVDKRQAQILVFDGDGALVGRSAALLGRAPGDASAPGVGLRTEQRQLREADLTTPAGRFVSEPGRNHSGEAVVWIDYEAALAIHRLRGGADHASRQRRLAGNDPAARRMSAGCVVVPGPFYDSVVQPWLGRQRGLVLVMPEGAAETDGTA